MEFGQLMIDILVYVSCKFQMYIFKTAQVINENVRIAFLYVLSIYRCLKKSFCNKLMHSKLKSKDPSRNCVHLKRLGVTPQKW